MIFSILGLYMEISPLYYLEFHRL